MNGKALILLVLAVLCGLGAMFGTNRMLSKQKNKPALRDARRAGGRARPEGRGGGPSPRWSS